MNNEKTPVEMLTELLATMTERAQEAERKHAEAKQDADRWFQLYVQKKESCEKAEAQLFAEIEAHKQTRINLTKMINGGPDNA